MKYKVSAMTNWDSRKIVSVFVRANSEYDARRIGAKKIEKMEGVFDVGPIVAEIEEVDRCDGYNE